MSEEQPSRKNRVCAIRCRLFLLGYSSNIGYSLAYAYKPASGTAYSSNPRAPSPRVPPVAPCARPAMRDKRSHVRRPALHSIFAARSMVGKIAARGYMYRSSRWGAPRLWAAALSSLSALSGFSPSAGKPCNPFPCARRPCSAECANAHPAGVRASGGRARPATLFNCAGFPSFGAFLRLRGSLCSPLRKRLPAPLWAPLRSAHASQARVRGI